MMMPMPLPEGREEKMMTLASFSPLGYSPNTPVETERKTLETTENTEDASLLYVREGRHTPARASRCGSELRPPLASSEIPIR
jgi:hypothetical protein